MIKTSIILEIQDNIPVWFPHEGLAINLSVATWLFRFCGWKHQLSDYPGLAHQVAEENWEKGELFFKSEPTQLWILGSKLVLN